MADEFSLEIKGLKEAQRAFFELGRQVRTKVVVAALKEGARVVQREAKRLAPKATGRLRSGIVVKRSRIHSGKDGRKVGVYLTLRTAKGAKSAFYGRFQEDGWNVRGKARKKLGMKGGRMQYAGRGEINTKFGKRRGRMTMPGKRDIPGKKFINRAFTSKQNEALRAIVAAVDRGIENAKRMAGLE